MKTTTTPNSVPGGTMTLNSSSRKSSEHYDVEYEVEMFDGQKFYIHSDNVTVSNPDGTTSTKTEYIVYNYDKSKGKYFEMLKTSDGTYKAADKTFTITESPSGGGPEIKIEKTIAAENAKASNGDRIFNFSDDAIIGYNGTGKKAHIYNNVIYDGTTGLNKTSDYIGNDDYLMYLWSDVADVQDGYRAAHLATGFSSGTTAADVINDGNSAIKSTIPYVNRNGNFNYKTGVDGANRIVVVSPPNIKKGITKYRFTSSYPELK